MRRHRKKDKECSTKLQHIYIDTCYFHAYLIGDRDEKEISNQIFQKIFKCIENPNIKVIIPFIVVGEVINNINRKIPDKDKTDVVMKFWRLIKNLKADFAPPRSECFKLANKIIETDDRIEAVDSEILSQALCDPNSSHLLCSDTKVLHSNQIKDLEKTMRKNNERNRKLYITDEF